MTASLEHLARDVPFEWVLPGHGSVGHDDPGRMRGRLERLVARMRQREGAAPW